MEKSIYIELIKTFINGSYVPGYLAHNSMPITKYKVIELNPGDCIYLASFILSDDNMEVQVTECRVSNLDGKFQEEILNTYFLRRPYLKN